MKNGNKKAIMIGTLILLMLVGIFVVIYLFNKPLTVTGEKSITIEVTGSRGTTTDYKLETDAEFLKQAMDELTVNGSGFIYSGKDSNYGFIVETINGEWAKYDKNGTYWALYVNDEFGQFMVNMQPVADGDKFTFKYEKSQQ